MSRDVQGEVLKILEHSSDCNVCALKRSLTASLGFCTHQEVERAIEALQKERLVVVSRKVGGVVYYRKGENNEQ